MCTSITITIMRERIYSHKIVLNEGSRFKVTSFGQAKRTKISFRLVSQMADRFGDGLSQGCTNGNFFVICRPLTLHNVKASFVSEVRIK